MASHIQRTTLFAAVSAVVTAALICLLNWITYHEMVVADLSILAMVTLLAFFDIISDT